MVSATKNRRKYLTDKQLNEMPLHKLLAIGLRDVRKQETTKGCRIDMYVYLDGSAKQCRACLAGSVVRHSMFKPFVRDECLVEHWMDALDWLRLGCISDALESLGRPPADDMPSRCNVPRYENDREAWWVAMRQLQKDLKAAGI